MSLLAVRDVAKRYGGITALAGVSFAIDAPGIYGLIGPNGAGKTTLFDAIAGGVDIDGGAIEIDGRDVTRLPVHARARLGLARSFQECRVLPEFSCTENLLFARQAKGLGATLGQLLTRSRAADRAARGEAARLLDLVNLSAYADQPASVLSFGQRRLLEIVCTFIAGPRLLLLDEPAAGVNPVLLETLVTALRTMFAERGGVFLVVEHNMEFIMGLAGDIVVMHQGAVLERGSPAAIQASPRVIEAYLG
jgi:ABC-type branched-subunit amino acid transport system ATPase component